jgi:ankyrin repeat protein
MAGDEARVAELLASDPSLAQRAAARDPARITHAAELGRLDAIRLLVRIGFDVNVKERVTPLHQAAYNGDRAMVELLLGMGADPTIRDAEFDATPAGWAGHANHTELAVHLAALEQGGE